MVTYTCSECKKKFDHKNDYIKHTNRKSPCIKNGNLQIDRTYQEVSNVSLKLSQYVNENESYVCTYCKSELSNKYNLERHTKLYCKAKKQQEESITTYEKLKMQIDEQKDEIEKLKNKLNVDDKNITNKTKQKGKEVVTKYDNNMENNINDDINNDMNENRNEEMTSESSNKLFIFLDNNEIIQTNNNDKEIKLENSNKLVTFSDNNEIMISESCNKLVTFSENNEIIFSDEQKEYIINMFPENIRKYLYDLKNPLDQTEVILSLLKDKNIKLIIKDVINEFEEKEKYPLFCARDFAKMINYSESNSSKWKKWLTKDDYVIYNEIKNDRVQNVRDGFYCSFDPKITNVHSETIFLTIEGLKKVLLNVDVEGAKEYKLWVNNMATIMKKLIKYIHHIKNKQEMEQKNYEIEKYKQQVKQIEEAKQKEKDKYEKYILDRTNDACKIFKHPIRHKGNIYAASSKARLEKFKIKIGETIKNKIMQSIILFLIIKLKEENDDFIMKSSFSSFNETEVLVKG